MAIPGPEGPSGEGQPPSRAGWTSLLDSLPLGLILADPTGRLVEANPAAARLLGLPRAALLSLGLEALQARAEATDAGPRRWTRASGEPVQLGWAVETLPDGAALVRFEDLTEAEAKTARLERLTQLYAALSQVNQAIVWSANRQALLDKICEVMVVHGRFSTAWIGWDDPATHQVEVKSQYGDRLGILSGLQVRSDDSPLGRGGVGRSIREQRSCVINDFLGTAGQGPWYARAALANFAAMASIPIRQGERIQATLVVYATEKDYFGPQELALLEEVAGDVAFALEHLELDAQREKAEKGLHDALEFGRKLLDARPLGTQAFHGESGRCVLATEGVTRIVGGSVPELLAQNFRTIESWKPAGLLAAAEQALATGEDQLLETRVRTVFQREVWLSCHFTTFLAHGERHLLLSLFDLSERMRAETALRESEERYRTQFELSSEGILAHTPGGELIDVNEAFARMHGYTRAEILGMTIADLDTPESGLHAEDRHRRILAGENPVFEVEHRHKDGHTFPLEVSGGLVHTGGQTIVLAYHRDITERKRTEQAQRQAQKLESLGILAGGIAHDFNNLLTAIMGNLNLAQASVGEYSQARPYLEKVENTVLKAAELSRQMLAYSGKGHFVVKPRDLNAIIQEMTGLLAASLPKKLHLELQLAPVLPLFKADGAQIQQVVMNLITNAAEAIGNQDGRISITTYNAGLDREVLSSGFPGQTMEAGNYVVLSVADSGCGMTPETQARIFDPFFTTKASGRGLGLSAMLGILKGHKAGIRIETEPGQGSSFEVFFPALDEGEARQEQAPSRRERHLAGTVLLVDDEEIILESTGPALESLGFRVVKARDGIQALEQFTELGKELALVFMDLSMPRMDGTSTFLAMHRARPEIPVVLTSGYDQKEATEDLLAQGLAGFIQKPYRIRDLARELDRILTGRGLG